MPAPSAASLLPVFVTLIVALSARNVLAGLFSGVVTGVVITGGAMPLQFLPVLIRDHIVPEVADGYNASVLVLLAFIGGFVKLIETSGGGIAFASTAARWVTDRLHVQVAAWCGGVMIFFSDLGTPLIVGPVFQPLMDRLGVSRQKLAFILDSTASPVAILVPFIGWGVFIMSVIADAFRSSAVDVDEWDAFVGAIPYQLYAWLAVSMVPFVALSSVDYGPMRQAEVAARAAHDPVTTAATQAGRARPMFVWLPLMVLGITLFATLAPHGFPFARVAGTDFRAALASAYLLAAVTLMVLIATHRVQPFLDSFTLYIDGVTGMMPIAATLVLAWALGTVSENLGTGTYVAELARTGLPAPLLPAVTFILAAIISFATGSSWGTIIIMMPLAVPAALATGAHMPVVIGAVLSGGLFGDHSSPVSETTILSSTGAGTTPIEHFRTQLPYALTNGMLALGGYLVVGSMPQPWFVAVIVALQCSGLLLLRRFRFKVRAD